jgi:transposase
MRTLREKIALVHESMQPGNSVAGVARKHGVNANLLFGWARLHRRGLLIEQRHGKPAPLLPVKITTPILTPTEPDPARTKDQAKRRATESSRETMLELILPDGTCVRLYGEAQLVALDRILAQLPSR